MCDDKASSPINERLLDSFRGRWIALLNGQIIGHGGSPKQALLAARQSRYKETPEVVFVPLKNTLKFPIILEEIIPILPPGIEVYLVGGAIRDALLNRNINDLDFVVAEKSLRIARRVADAIGAAYFPLDLERETARIVLVESTGERLYLDFSTMRGNDIESDLIARDFTINAMAVNVHDREKIIDPLNGAADLLSRRLRACNTSAIQDDPVRILRAIRIAGDYELKIVPETLALMRNAKTHLSEISAERITVELFHILSGTQSGRAFRALEMLGVIPYILPELSALKSVDQSAPHTLDVWEHTLAVLNHLEEVLDLIGGDYDPEKATNLINGMLVTRLGRFREQISEHLRSTLNVDRPFRGLLFFTALYHDVGKQDTARIDSNNRIRFFGHDKVGSILASKRARNLRLSNLEIERVSIIIGNHLRPILLSQQDDLPTRRAIYRFFRDTGPAGVDICLLALADTLATYGVQISPDTWQKQIDVIRTLFEAWWDHAQDYVSPPVLIKGGDILEKFNLSPGPLIGELLEAVREAQAMGLIQTQEQSLLYVEQLLQERDI